MSRLEDYRTVTLTGISSAASTDVVETYHYDVSDAVADGDLEYVGDGTYLLRPRATGPRTEQDDC